MSAVEVAPPPPLFRGMFIVIKRIEAFGVLGLGDDQFRCGENSIRNPARLEERHHLAGLHIFGEGIRVDGFERMADLHPNQVLIDIDYEQKRAAAVAAHAAGQNRELLHGRDVDVAGLAGRENPVIDPVVAEQEFMEFGDALALIGCQHRRVVFDQCRRRQRAKVDNRQDRHEGCSGDRTGDQPAS
ncbi:hypothetical protein QW131_31865 [Roseibium salinum]|nr:hypothetical protein [Roseibium salinum]